MKEKVPDRAIAKITIRNAIERMQFTRHEQFDS